MNVEDEEEEMFLLKRIIEIINKQTKSRKREREKQIYL